jgi:hypothetical protein
VNTDRQAIEIPAGRSLSEAASFALLPLLPRPRFVHTDDPFVAVSFADTCAAVVAKVSGVAHKTEVRGVRVGLNAAALESCFGELAALGDGTVVVVEQVSLDAELIVGALRDEQFGTVITVGLGGVIAEAFHDVSIVLAPPEAGELDAALDQLRSAALINGFRGRAPLNRTALAAIVDAVSELMDTNPDVLEIDVNPVGVVDGLPVVLDCLVVMK